MLVQLHQCRVSIINKPSCSCSAASDCLLLHLRKPSCACLTAGAGLRLDTRVRGPVQCSGMHNVFHKPLCLCTHAPVLRFMQPVSPALCGAGAEVQRGGSGEPAAPEPAYSCLHRALHALRPRLRGAGCLQQLAGSMASIGVSAHRSRQVQ